MVQCPALQHRALAAAEPRGPDAGNDGTAARRGPEDHPELAFLLEKPPRGGYGGDGGDGGDGGEGGQCGGY